MQVIGRGSFGKVMLVRKKEGRDAGQLYALKTLRKQTLLRRNQVDHTRTERAILQHAAHPFIVHLKYAFQVRCRDTVYQVLPAVLVLCSLIVALSRSGFSLFAAQTRDKLYLVTDFAPGGELFFWLKRDRVFSQSRVRLYAAELVLALEHLHNHDIVYRDLKPENILLDEEGHIKLTDFGLSKAGVEGSGYDGGARTFCGTPEYLAPEILENAGHGKAVDWWSLATLLYEMCAGLPPFYDTNMDVMYDKIMSAELVFPRHFMPETRSLLAGMLERDVTKRLGYNGAHEIKNHEFFKGMDWDAVLERRVTPEFKPPVGKSATDVSNFEEEFTQEVPEDSVNEMAGALSSTQADRAHFEGFTYMGDAPIGGDGDDDDDELGP